MPRPKKPTHLKALQGTKQPCRDRAKGIDAPTMDDLPDPPDWLPNSLAAVEFTRLAKSLHACGALTEASITPLAHLAAIHGKLVQVWAAGCMPNAALLGAYRNLCTDFGLSPSARTRLPSNPHSKATNSFSNHGKPTK